MKTRPDLAALAFCGLVVVACAVLAALGKPIPEFLQMIGLVVAGVGGGAALNTSPAAAPAPTVTKLTVTELAAPAPAPSRHYTDPAETGVFARPVSWDH